MRLTSAVNLGGKDNRPHDAALDAIALLRDRAITDPLSQLTIEAFGRANSRFLAELETALPSGPGERTGRVPGHFRYTLDESTQLEDVLSRLENLVRSQPEALATVRLSITAEKIRWRGGPPDATGALHLVDLPARGRGGGQRPAVFHATFTCRGTSIADPSFLATLRTVAEQTGVAFDQGRLSGTQEPDEGLSAEQRFAIEVALEEALGNVAAEFRRRRLDWRGRAGLMPYDEAIEFRFQHWGEGGRVSVNASVKRLMKSQFPAFTLTAGRGLWFSRPLTDDLAVHLAFDSDRLGTIGKGFTLLLGVEGRSSLVADLVWRTSFFRAFGADGLNPCWTYASADDLDAALRELAPLVSEVLASFETHARRLLDPLPRLDTLPPDVRRGGPLTAREAAREALPQALAWSSEAELIRLTSVFNPLRHDLLELGPAIGLDGRLRLAGYWGLLYRSREHPRLRLLVEVPFLGSIRSSPCSGPEREDSPIRGDWLDSDQIVSIVENHGGRSARDGLESPPDIRCELRAGASPTGLDSRGTPLPQTQTDQRPSGLWWEVEYTMTSRGRVRTRSERLDAATGAHACVIDQFLQ